MRKSFLTASSLLIWMACSAGVSAQIIPITIPDGNFATAGGPTSGAVTNQKLGSTPWFATSNGIDVSLGILNVDLAAPSLSVGSGSATINGLLGSNVIGLLNTSGTISQIVPTAYLPNTTYQFEALVTYSGAINVGLLTGGSVGIALTDSNGNILASSATAGNTLYLGVLGQPKEEELVIDYKTGPVVSNDIGISLFANPSSLVSLGVDNDVSFSGLELETVPENSTYAMLASGILALILLQRWNKSKFNMPA